MHGHWGEDVDDSSLSSEKYLAGFSLTDTQSKPPKYQTVLYCVKEKEHSLASLVTKVLKANFNLFYFGWLPTKCILCGMQKQSRKSFPGSLLDAKD